MSRETESTKRIWSSLHANMTIENEGGEEKPLCFVCMEGKAIFHHFSIIRLLIKMGFIENSPS